MPTVSLYLNHLVGELPLITLTPKKTPKPNKNHIPNNVNNMTKYLWILELS